MTTLFKTTLKRALLALALLSFIVPVLPAKAQNAAAQTSGVESAAPAAKVPQLSLQTSPRMRKETQYIVMCMERAHYLKMPITELDAREFIREYMQNLDFFKLFFTSEDVQQYQDLFAPVVDLMLRQGTLLPAFSIYDRFLERTSERLAWIKERMKKPFDLDKDADFRPDRSKEEWPKDMKEADELWEKRISYDIINQILGYTVEEKDRKEAEKEKLEKAEKSAAAADSAGAPVKGEPSDASKGALSKSGADLKPASANSASGSEAPKAEKSSSKPENGEASPAKLASGEGGGDPIVKPSAEEESLENPKAPSKSEMAELSEEEKIPETFEGKLEKAVKEVLKRYEMLISNYGKADAMEVQEIYLNTLSHLYDPHSAFLSEYYLEEFDISVRNALVGIGAILRDKDGYCTIEELMPGGPAEECKQIKPGDKIIAVGQENGEMVDVIGQKLRKTVRMIRGAAGTKVRLLIEPESAPSSRKTITLVRREIKLTTKLARAAVYTVPVGNETVPVGVIDLPAFYGEGGENSSAKGFSTTKDVEELLGKLKKMGVKGIILDLRRNGGGFLNEAVDLAGLFVKTGPVVQVRDSQNRTTQLRDENEKVAWSGPLIILVSRLSASATEIVAGALKNHERALIVGDKSTHGKGTVQAVLQLENWDSELKSAAKVTVQKWYAPNGESIQLKGVHPDIVLPSPYDYMEIGEEYKDYAMKWDSISPDMIDEVQAYGFPKGSEKAFISELDRRTRQRQKSLDEFKVWNSRVDWVKSRKDKKDWSINYQKRLGELNADEAYNDDLKKKEKELSKLAYQKKEVFLDSAEENEHKKSGEKKDSQKKLSPEESSEFDIDDENAPEFDVQLREALRIMADWLELKEKPEIVDNLVKAGSAGASASAAPSGQAGNSAGQVGNSAGKAKAETVPAAAAMP